jgi:RimJ/RimL family protein N-acetyltransferase
VSAADPRPVTLTDRLRLEPMSMAHLDDMAAMLADPQVGATMGGVRDRAWTEAVLGRHLQRWTDNGFGLWAAYSLQDGGFVGRGGIQHTTVEDEAVVEVGWCLPPHQWGHGYATEIGRAGLRSGFEDQRLDEIVAFTQPFNSASVAVMERLGMTYVRPCVFVGLDHVLYQVRRPR